MPMLLKVELFTVFTSTLKSTDRKHNSLQQGGKSANYFIFISARALVSVTSLPLR